MSVSSCSKFFSLFSTWHYTTSLLRTSLCALYPSHLIMKCSTISLTFTSLFGPNSAIYVQEATLGSSHFKLILFPDWLSYLSFFLALPSFNFTCIVPPASSYHTSISRQCLKAAQTAEHICTATLDCLLLPVFCCQVPILLFIVYIFPLFYICLMKYYIPSFAVFIWVLKEPVCVSSLPSATSCVAVCVCSLPPSYSFCLCYFHEKEDIREWCKETRKEEKWRGNKEEDGKHRWWGKWGRRGKEGRTVESDNKRKLFVH